MTLVQRWIRFNAVGAAGMAVQLGSLALLNRGLHGRYLLASSAALEITLLHNFLWHARFTWRERQERCSRCSRLLRFHLTSGAISLSGNLLLMRPLVHQLHLPLLLANALAILACSVANFTLTHYWTFRSVISTLQIDGVRPSGASPTPQHISDAAQQVR